MNDFDLFLFDQFGVLHNGVAAYPGMHQEISVLKSANKQVSVISNSGKRAVVNAARLARFGFDTVLIDKVYTSGEVAWQFLRDQFDDKRDVEPTVYVIGNGDDRSAIAGLPLLETPDIDKATLILIAGRGSPSRSLAEFGTLFVSPISRDVSALCTNPDHLSLGPGEQLLEGPGQIAMTYESMGGQCRYIGKPHGEIYAHIQRDTGVPANRILCIGDSIEHDIVGAHNAGCASMLVRTGILQASDEMTLAQLMKTHATPDYVLESRPA